MDYTLVPDTLQGVVAVIEYDYKAKESDELDLIKGQMLHNIIQQPGGWWEGTLASSGRTGMFPDNFVRILNNNENNTVALRQKTSTVQRRCKAIYSYTQVNEDELSLAVGDEIEFLAEVEEGWWRGKLNNKIGVFPSNFVVAMERSPIFASKRPTSNAETKGSTHKLTSANLAKSQISLKEDIQSSKRLISPADAQGDTIAAPLLPPRPVKEFCRVEFPYSPQNDDELELITGEIIAIVNKELPDKGWWKGEVNGKIGVFPDNFVKLLPLEETATASDSVVKTTTKKTNNLSTQSTSRLDSFGSKNSLDEILNETGLQTGNVAAQRMSLENKNFELITPTTSIDRASKQADFKTGETRKSIESLDDKKVPPPLLTKKPIVPGKKVAGSILSGLRQKVKNVEQKTTASEDISDGCITSKLNIEQLDNNEDSSSLGRLKDGDSDFDKVERSSILLDMRAGRVKAPKRRPPSVASNLPSENTNINALLLNGNENSLDEHKYNADDGDELVKPKGRGWEAKKVPWMDELKASQIKKKTSPSIEPRTTLVDTSLNANFEMKKPDHPAASSSKSKKTFETHSTSSEVSSQSKTSSLHHYSISVEKQVKSEIDTSKVSISNAITNVLVSDDHDAEDIEVKSPLTPTKIDVTRMHKRHIKAESTPVTLNNVDNTELSSTGESKLKELEKRIQSLEEIVQVQNKTIQDLQRLLGDESNRIELLKNQLEKYAQCVTQV